LKRWICEKDSQKSQKAAALTARGRKKKTARYPQTKVRRELNDKNPVEKGRESAALSNPTGQNRFQRVGVVRAA